MDAVLDRLGLVTPERALQLAMNAVIAGIQNGNGDGDNTRVCVVCIGEFGPDNMARLPCDHNFCQGCLRETFKMALTDERLIPVRCCQQNMLDAEPRVQALLGPQLVAQYRDKKVEAETPNRTYCHKPKCSAFIPPQHIVSEIATCPRCRATTCSSCKAATHKGTDCPVDEAAQKLLDVAKKEGWKQCHACKTVIELKQGCNHMTCRCGAEFCYVCGKVWKQKGQPGACACDLFHEATLRRQAQREAAARGEGPPEHELQNEVLGDLLDAAWDAPQNAARPHRQPQDAGIPWGLGELWRDEVDAVLVAQHEREERAREERARETRERMARMVQQQRQRELRELREALEYLGTEERLIQVELEIQERDAQQHLGIQERAARLQHERERERRARLARQHRAHVIQQRQRERRMAEERRERERRMAEERREREERMAQVWRQREERMAQQRREREERMRMAQQQREREGRMRMEQQQRERERERTGGNRPCWHTRMMRRGGADTCQDCGRHSPRSTMECLDCNIQVCFGCRHSRLLRGPRLR
ncbi:hypothetical protein KVR01_010566 [Diaporthe batatas]|uniref:uncharacterized protein n=1 Tax=Diaporthe batatas TaxID=748121 RepID=UPI001D046FC6|nr:uncharacterized protein KVR01_010566 [Diaporthe batatas]KAG8159929.1 hypothetical protein KVR01_010566 [Diaporthe batatas]